MSELPRKFEDESLLYRDLRAAAGGSGAGGGKGSGTGGGGFKAGQSLLCVVLEPALGGYDVLVLKANK
jgi:hypothetical protein